MKLDGDLAFYHSNNGLDPESQSFEFNDNDQKLKENEKRVSVDLKKNKVDLDLLPHDMETENNLTASKPDLKNDNEVKVKDFMEPVSHATQDIELFTKFPIQDIDPPEEVDSFKNSADIYTDISVMECDKESNCHEIKDICVDEGIPVKDKLLFENNVNKEAASKFSPSKDHDSEKMTNDNAETDVPFLVDLPATEESDKVSSNHCKSDDLMSRDGNDDDVDKEMVPLGHEILLEEGNKTEQNDSKVTRTGESELNSKPEESEDRAEEAVSTDPLALAVNESNGDTPIGDSTPGNGGSSSRVDPPAPAPAASAKEESDQVGGLKCDASQIPSEPADGKVDDQTITSHVRHSLGESSFSAVGHVSNRISYSDPVPYSGSISHRSDSSTTSTRSFAFPVMQSEWNSSPVRMAKADRRNYRKHRCWRQGLLCCRF